MRRLISVALAAALLLASASVVMAKKPGLVGPPSFAPIDVCYNLPGLQASVPVGMHVAVDEFGVLICLPGLNQ